MPRRRNSSGSPEREEAVAAAAVAGRARARRRASVVLDLVGDRLARGDDLRRRARARAGASGARAGSGCSRGSPCRRPASRSGAQASSTHATVRSSTSPPAWISGASSADATACSSASGAEPRRARGRRRRWRPSRAWRAARPGRCASPRAASRDSGRTTPTTSHPSRRAPRAAPAAPPPWPSCTRRRAASRRASSSMPASSRANARSSSGERVAVREPRGVAEVEEVLVRQRHEALVQHGEAADPGVEDGDRQLCASGPRHGRACVARPPPQLSELHLPDGLLDLARGSTSPSSLPSSVLKPFIAATTPAITRATSRIRATYSTVPWPRSPRSASDGAGVGESEHAIHRLTSGRSGRPMLRGAGRRVQTRA